MFDCLEISMAMAFAFRRFGGPARSSYNNVRVKAKIRKSPADSSARQRQHDMIPHDSHRVAVHDSNPFSTNLSDPP